MFGSFGETQAATPDTKRARQEEKNTCIPVTVRILQDAVAAATTSDNQEVLIHGSEAGIVHVVGVVEALVQQTAMLEFQLNDASGRIKVRHYSSGPALGEGLEGLTSGTYVSIIGNLRTSPATHVSAMSLRAVSNADEVSYHMIEVALATLSLRSPVASGAQPGGLSLSGGVKASDPGTPSPVKRVEAESTISPMKVNAPMQVMPSDPITPPSQLRPAADLRSSVLSLLREEQGKAGEEGLGLGTILTKLAHCQTPPSKVQELLSAMVTEGEIYTTIDDDHFNIL